MEINTITPTISISNENIECAICLSNITDEVPLLSCNHLFHIKCIVKWSKVQLYKKFIQRCPLCKSKYNYRQFAANVLKYNTILLHNMINKLEFIINNNNNIAFINYIRIKLLIYNYTNIYNKIKYEKNPTSSEFFNNLNFTLHPNIQKLLLNTNSKENTNIDINLIKENDICKKSKKYMKICNFL
jgi:hypothetical protein